MEAYLLDWLNLLLRWAHVIVGIAWIGASFYFIWLDNHLEPSRDPKLAGELWAIHGGGFYRAEKYKLGPAELPRTLHWFKWEAYWTWITGFALLVSFYYVNAEVYLIDPQVMPLSKAMAIGISIGSLIVWLAAYEGLCRSGMSDNVLAVVLFLLLVATAWTLTQVFSGRGAFIHYGAIIGTIMVGNVAHVIIPGQRRMVQAVTEGRAPDPKDGAMGKQRSVHNTYFTLPVVLVMISNHHAMLFGHRWNWLVLVGMTLAGALIRVWFVMRHKGRAPAWVWIAGALATVAVAWLIAPQPQPVTTAKVSYAEVRHVLEERCTACHAQRPSFQGIAEAPKGVMLDSEERVRAHAAQIHQQTVLSRAMPPGNLTKMTEPERELLRRYLAR
ncbi:MAG TPA: urate hydroxylase PuuD [Burkholderiales bacterium]|nr:urate hydroxylase PuuD [Burkholderiales bacterium]